MKKRIDDHFKDNIDTRSFEFQEAAWDAVSKELDKKDRKRKLPFIWLFVGIGLSGLLLFSDLSGGIETDSDDLGPAINLAEVNEEIQPATNPLIPDDPKGPSLIAKKDVEKVSTSAVNHMETFDENVSKSNKKGNPLYDSGIQTKSAASNSFEEVASKKPTVISEGQIIDNQLDITLSRNNESTSVTPLQALDPVPFLKSGETYPAAGIELDWKEAVIPVLKKSKPSIGFGLLAEAGVDNSQKGLSIWGLGGYFDFHLSRKWHLELAGLYSEYSADFGEQGHSSQVKYSFGQSRLEQSLIAEKISLVEIPVYLRRNIRRHSLGAGVQFNLLLNVKGAKEVKESNTLQGLARVSRQPGIIERTNDIPGINYALIGKYQYDFPKFSIGVKGNYLLRNYRTTETASANLGMLRAILKFNLK